MDGLGSDDAPARERRFTHGRELLFETKGNPGACDRVGRIAHDRSRPRIRGPQVIDENRLPGQQRHAVQPQRPDLLRAPELQLEVPGGAQGWPLQKDERWRLQADRRRPEQLQRGLRSASGAERRAESRDKGGKGQAEQPEGRLQVRDALARAGASGLVQGRLVPRARGWERSCRAPGDRLGAPRLLLAPPPLAG